MNRRVSLLLAALLVAVVGTAAVFAYVSRLEDKTLAGAEPVDVLVAASTIAAGTTADSVAAEKLVEVKSLPRKAVPEGALTELDGLGAQALVSDVFAGEVLLRAKFADRTAKTGALVIPGDKMAISVELGDPQRVAGFVVPGAEVAIFATIERQSGTATATATQSGDSATVDVTAQVDSSYTELLLPRTSIIAVGPSTLKPREEDEDEGEEAVATTVLTLAVSQAEAERLVHAINNGELYFGLLSATSATGDGAGVTTANLFS